MNLNIISEKLKTKFTTLLSEIPLNTFPPDSVEPFVIFYKRLFYRLYKLFGFDYAYDLAHEIGIELSYYIPSIESVEDYTSLFNKHTHEFLDSLDKHGLIDHSKYKYGLSGNFYENLTLFEQELYRNYIFNNIVYVPRGILVVQISKFCVKHGIDFKEYMTRLADIYIKHKNWEQEFIKEINGSEIKF